MARVMIVDHTPFMRGLHTSILTENGHEVVYQAADGLEAVKAYSIVLPEIVIMDFCLTKLDGVTALQRILAIDPIARIIMCSSYVYQGFVLKTIELGAKDFIAKHLLLGS